MATGSNNIETLMQHAGSHPRDLTTTSAAVPIYQTTSYEFNNAEHPAQLLSLQDLRNIHTIITTPTTQVLM